MPQPPLADLVAAANASLADPARNRIVSGSGSGDAGRFELYHSALSLCSYKVRCVLAEKGIAWRSHDIGILPPLMENYQPDYVRLRLRGGSGKTLVDGYSGRSSATSEGFDPCAVPTLVDHQLDKVIVDSKTICEHIDQHAGSGPDLIPARFRKQIEQQLAIVDRTPHLALLYGVHPDHDGRPQKVRDTMSGIHDYKIMRLMENRSLAVGDAGLVAAYDQKIRKEAAARAFVRDEQRMRQIIEETDGIIDHLENDLGGDQEWLCGDMFTLADSVWSVSLFQLQWLGMGYLWQNGKRPKVAAYARKLFRRPAFKTAVPDWPGNPDFLSEYVMEYYAGEQQQETATTPRRRHGSTADIREETLTEAVRSTLAGARNPRAKKVLDALVRHLHAFVEEVQPSEAEWEKAITFLTRTGQLCNDDRQEFILLSDVLGVTTRVDLTSHRFPAGATEHSVLGPFFVADRPAFDNGADITNGVAGPPLFVSCRVLDNDNKPVAGARVDIWHSDDAGHYDIMMPNRQGRGHGRERLALRGLFRSDYDGRFWFTSIVPSSYPIPTDGTVGELLNTAGRSPVRPAHLHVRIEAPGFERLTTMLFVAGDEHLDSDPVFGVKSSLIVPFEKPGPARHAPDGAALPAGCYAVGYDFVLTKKR